MKNSRLPLLIALGILLLLALFFPRRSPVQLGGETPVTAPKAAQRENSLFKIPELVGVRTLGSYPSPPPARQHASMLRRGENNRLLLPEAVLLKRESAPGTISSEQVLIPRSKRLAGPLTKDEHTLSAIECHLDPRALRRFIESSDESLILPLDQNREAVVTITEVISRGNHSHTLHGQVAGNSYSDVLLVVHDGAVSGSVAFRDHDLHFQYAMAGNGDAAIRLLDVTSFPAGCGDVEMTGLANSNPDTLPKTENPAKKGVEKAPPAGTDIIDTVIGYGAQSRSAQGGVAAIEAHILAAVDRCNLAFSNSGAHIAFLSLLATVEDPNYNFPGNYPGSMGSSDELGDLDVHGDGRLDTISQLRIDLGADQNGFVIRQADGYAGVAYLNDESLLVARDYMTSNRMVYAHELGHNIGCRHSWGDSGGDTNFIHQYGWRLRTPSGVQVRTIMAYDWNWGTGARIPYFANPSVRYNGAKTGAQNGESVLGNSSADSRYYSGGLIGNAGRGFDGSNPSLGARNGPFIAQNARFRSNAASRSVLAVLEPTGSKRWDRGETETIFWYGGDHSDLVTIDLLKDGTKQMQIASNVTAHKRFFDWEIPNLPNGSNYSIRVTINGVLTAESSLFEIFSRENDEDGDGLPNPFETGTGVFLSNLDTGTDPNDFDSDDDGFSDALEVAVGTDPNRGAFFPPHGGFILLENFESRLFTLNETARRIRGWESPDKVDGLTVELDPDNPENRTGVINGKGSSIDIFLPIPNLIEEFSQGTIYFEIRLQDDDNTSIGLSARPAPFSWSHFEAQLQLKDGTYVFDGPSERLAGQQLENERWVRFWIQVDNDIDTFQVYRQDFPSEEDASPPLVLLETADAQNLFSFRNGTSGPLQSFAIRTSSKLTSGEKLHLDNLYLNPNEISLSNPTLVDQRGFTLMEDFESEDYNLSESLNQMNSWNAINDPQALTVEMDPDSPSNRVGALNGVSRLTDVFLRLPMAIPNRDAGTLFFEIRPEYGGTLSIGLSDESQPFLRSSYEAELLFQRSYFIWGLGSDVNSQSRPPEHEWLKVWIVAQNDVDRFEVYTQATEESEPTLLEVPSLGSSFPMRNGTDSVLRTLLIQPGLTLAAGEHFYLDNIYLDSQAANLTDPTLIPDFPVLEGFSFTDDTIEMSVSGLRTDQRYLLERTDDLGGLWTIVEEGFVPSSTRHTFSDDEPNSGQGFYRFQVEILQD